MTDNTQETCLYSCSVKDGVKLQECMPNGGLNNMSKFTTGEIVKMGNGDKYQVINCKYPRCL